MVVVLVVTIVVVVETGVVVAWLQSNEGQGHPSMQPDIHGQRLSWSSYFIVQLFSHSRSKASHLAIHSAKFESDIEKQYDHSTSFSSWHKGLQ